MYGYALFFIAQTLLFTNSGGVVCTNTTLRRESMMYERVSGWARQSEGEYSASVANHARRRQQRNGSLLYERGAPSPRPSVALRARCSCGVLSQRSQGFRWQ